MPVAGHCPKKPPGRYATIREEGRDKMRALLSDRTILLFLAGSLFVASSCRKDGGGGKNFTAFPPFSSTPVNSFKLVISGLQTNPRAEITPPVPGAIPTTLHSGITMDFHDQESTLTAGTFIFGGSSATLGVTVKNVSGSAFSRAWLVVYLFDNGVQPDAQTATGFLNDGVYYYLGNLLDGQERQENISFIVPPGVDNFTVLMDVVTVHDRVVFQSVQPSVSPEIFSITPSATSLSRITYTDGALYPEYPVWAPDGGRVAYSAYPPGGDDQVYLARADGGGSQQLTCLSGFTIPGGFTRDGTGIYVRHYDPVLDEANVYLLDIAKGLQDCSDPGILTPLTISYPGSEVLPTVSLSRNLLLYPRRENLTYKPPDPLCQAPCGCFPLGSELQFTAFNLYLLPLDPATGLPNGAEAPYWKNSLFANGGMAFSPDGQSVVSNGGGCAGYQYYCKGGLPWALKCNLSLSFGLYRLDIPASLSDPSLPYSYVTSPGSGMYRYLTGTTFYDYDPSWSSEYNEILFTNLNFATSQLQLWYLDPTDTPIRAQVTKFSFSNFGGRFMPPAP